jgi:hypothetical protein
VKSRNWLGILACVAAVGGGAASAGAQETRKVVIGAKYNATGVEAAWIGSGYRSLWTSEVALPVLDLTRAGGGLTPVRIVGQAQSVGLALKGADGKAYTFRSLHKHPERMLPEEWRTGWPVKLAQELTTGTHPAAAVIQVAFARALDLPVTSPRLVIMPDDPALGEFRKQFAGEIGTIDEFPLPGSNGAPGYMGATEMLSTLRLWEQWLASPATRIDSRKLLRARIFDLWVDNYDRHSGQWRWMRIPGEPLLQPLPEDPDFVLVKHNGLLGAITRSRLPDFLNFGEKYPRRLEGPLNNCYEVDRWLLVDLDRAAWEAEAKDVASRLTDGVIETAVRSMPPEWYALSGAATVHDLKRRRDGLVKYILRVYDLEAKHVDIHASDQDDAVSVARGSNDSLDVSIAAAGASAPYYRRRFAARETHDVRVYLHGGNDRVTRTGAPGGRILVRVIGGGGRDVVDDSASGGSEVWRDAGEVAVTRGSGTSVHERVWENPEPSKSTPWVEPRSYGTWTGVSPVVGYSGDTGPLGGVAVTRTAWGFRMKQPTSSEQMFRAGIAPVDAAGFADYTGTFWRPDSHLGLRVNALASSVNVINFFGFGNETPKETDRARYRARQRLFSFSPKAVLEIGRRFEAYVGPEVRYSKTVSEGDSILGDVRPLGFDQMGRFALRGGFEFDSREPASHTDQGGEESNPLPIGETTKSVTGIAVRASGFVVPKAWDATSSYGGVDGVVTAYVGNERAHLAVRAGGQKRSGDYAWFDGAFIGGRFTRGYASHRFTGDASLFGTVALRGWMATVPIIVPVRIGAIAFADTGRVWLEGETSDVWHHSFGGGLMARPLATSATFFVAVGHSKEGNRYYAGFGLPF